MRDSLRSRLTLSYILISLVCILTISILTNVFLEKQFREYTIRNQERKNEEIADLIGKQYGDNGVWNYTAIENIGVNVIEQGMIIKVIDNYGRVMWDAAVHNNGLCKQMLDDMINKMSRHYNNWDGKYRVKEYSIYHNKNKIGNVVVGYYGPFYYNDNDFAFIHALNKFLIGTGVFSLFFALILGGFMAKWLSNPITRVIRTAENISKGYFKNRVKEKSKTREIKLLISTINNLAETLERQQLLRKRMSADVAHELRTPLATIQSYVEAMIDGIWKPDRERLMSCHEEIMRITRLVGDLEKLAKYESEKHKLNKIEYDIYEQIQSIIYNFETNFKNKGVELHFYGKSENIVAERDKISQVIINLISNALKYTPKHGLVEIRVGRREDMVKVSVKDTGIGISPEDLPFVFERFYRADKSRNKLTGGSGIGLTIAKTIVDLHKGRITVQNNFDKGTEFVVLLPKASSNK
ncbi:sensor histidine kinase [Clostridium kluyveri]|uniref:histidine kinase n=1 Tax=Clostridium kluyveri TaxID=1534 RepID=A0A1L5F5Z9_CLOKL|nr:ATP-binding protein [Clostridium kluyveri]APM38435.1 two-component sensor histidine kinase [Clostridium kluyveri]UZQ50718.1 ATP-binding protein [Clostridium kluyveri]